MPNTTIHVKNNGPLRLEGDFEIKDAAGNSYGLGGRNVVSLCRCGQSESKPFCDGTHNRNGFASDCVARDLPPPAPKP